MMLQIFVHCNISVFGYDHRVGITEALRVRMRTGLKETLVGGGYLDGTARVFCRRLLAGSMATLCLMGISQPARSQTLDSEPDDVAGNRPQPAYDPIGIRAGKLMIRPGLTVSPDFASNLFATADDPKSDASISIVPTIAAAITEPGANFTLFGEARIRRHATYASQDDEQFRVDASGSTELPSGFLLNAGIGWSDTTAGRGTVANDLTVGDPLKMRELRSRVSLRKSFNRLYASIGLSAARSTYGDVDLDDGSAIDQSFRNSRRIGGTLTLGYEVSPLLALQTRATYDVYRYSDPRPLSDRDAESYSIGVGLRYQITQLLTAEFTAGLRQHKFDNPLFAKIKGAALFGRLRWYPTPLISVRADLAQSTSTSTLDQVSAVTVTDFTLGADYEFRRNVLITAETGLAFEDYGQIGLQAKRLSLTGRAEWKANRWLRVGGYATLNSRFGTGSGPIRDYSAVQTGVRMTLAL